MKGYRLTETADTHLQDIWRFTRNRWDAVQANTYVAAIEAALDAAIKEPALLRPRSELAPGMLVRKAQSHIVYGYIDGDTLIVVAVLHSRMDPKRHDLRGGQ